MTTLSNILFVLGGALLFIQTAQLSMGVAMARAGQAKKVNIPLALLWISVVLFIAAIIVR